MRRRHGGHLSTAEVDEESFSKNRIKKSSKRKSKPSLALPSGEDEEDGDEEDVQFSGDEDSDSDSDEISIFPSLSSSFSSLLSDELGAKIFPFSLFGDDTGALTS